MAIFRDGRRLEGDEAEQAMQVHMARFSPSRGGSSPITGAAPQAQQRTGGGGKGGRPNIAPSEVAESGYNKDDKYGYYAPDGTYVSAFTDMRDGGGKNQSGNYFVGGGIISALLNAAKVRPAGAAREMRDGEYVVPISDIGYRDVRDMYDRGGPQASGGMFQGGGKLSALANLGYGLTGRDFGTRRTYAEQEARAALPRPRLRPQPIEAPTQDFSQLSQAPETRRSLAANYYSPQVVAGTPAAIPEAYIPSGAPTVLAQAPETPMPTLSTQEMRDYLKTKGIFTEYMPADLVAEMYRMQKGME